MRTPFGAKWVPVRYLAMHSVFLLSDSIPGSKFGPGIDSTIGTNSSTGTSSDHLSVFHDVDLFHIIAWRLFAAASVTDNSSRPAHPGRVEKSELQRDAGPFHGLLLRSRRNYTRAERERPVNMAVKSRMTRLTSKALTPKRARRTPACQAARGQARGAPHQG